MPWSGWGLCPVLARAFVADRGETTSRGIEPRLVLQAGGGPPAAEELGAQLRHGWHGDGQYQTDREPGSLGAEGWGAWVAEVGGILQGVGWVRTIGLLLALGLCGPWLVWE
jgi:hypothetical protein